MSKNLDSFHQSHNIWTPFLCLLILLHNDGGCRCVLIYYGALDYLWEMVFLLFAKMMVACFWGKLSSTKKVLSHIASWIAWVIAMYFTFVALENVTINCLLLDLVDCPIHEKECEPNGWSSTINISPIYITWVIHNHTMLWFIGLKVLQPKTLYTLQVVFKYFLYVFQWMNLGDSASLLMIPIVVTILSIVAIMAYMRQPIAFL